MTCSRERLKGKKVVQGMAIGDEDLEQGLRFICIDSPLSNVVLDT